MRKGMLFFLKIKKILKKKVVWSAPQTNKLIKNPTGKVSGHTHTHTRAHTHTHLAVTPMHLGVESSFLHVRTAFDEAFCNPIME